MSQKEYKQFINRELKEINDKIDLKIVWGVDYKDDARRHKMLTKQISKIRKQHYKAKILSYFTFNHVRSA